MEHTLRKYSFQAHSLPHIIPIVTSTHSHIYRTIQHSFLTNYRSNILRPVTHQEKNIGQDDTFCRKQEKKSQLFMIHEIHVLSGSQSLGGQFVRATSCFLRCRNACCSSGTDMPLSCSALCFGDVSSGILISTCDKSHTLHTRCTLKTNYIISGSVPD